jgi:orotate phosphoribosyltransferase
MHYLTTWWDILAVAKASGKFSAKMLEQVEAFMRDPNAWSKAHGGAAEAAE